MNSADTDSVWRRGFGRPAGLAFVERWLAPKLDSGAAPVWLIALVLAAGVAARFATLSADALWADELYSWSVTRMDWNRLLFVPYDVHPPFYYALLKLATAFGDSEGQLRALSAVFGLATVALVFAFARRHCGTQAALVGAAVALFSNRLIVHSSTARNYALMVMMCVAASWALVAVLERISQRRNPWPLAGGYALLAMGALMAHTASAIYLFVLSGLALVAFGASTPRRIPQIGGMLALMNAPAYLALAIWYLGARHSQVDFSWLTRLGALPSLRVLAGVMTPSNLPFPIVAVCFLCVLLGVLVAVLRARPSYWVPIVAMTVAFPMTIYVAGWIKPLFMERTILLAAPGAALAVAALAAGLRPPRAGLAVGGLVAAAFAVSALVYVTRDKSAESYGMQPIQDFRSAFRLVDAAIVPGAAVLTCDVFTEPSFDYYGAKPPYAHLVYLGGDRFNQWARSWLDYFGRPAPKRLSWTEPQAGVLKPYRRIIYLESRIFCSDKDPHGPLTAEGFTAKGSQWVQGFKIRIYDR